MSKVEQLIADIETRKIGATNKKVLIVEGVDDESVFSTFLDKREPTWTQRWVVAPANGKQRVIDVAAQRPDWIGVLDRDEWGADQLAAVGGRLNLFVLPRFCIESYLIRPAEIWAALPEKQRLKIAGGENALALAIGANLGEWKRHAALWHVIHPIYCDMRDSGHRDSLLDPAKVPDDARLAQVIRVWFKKFDIDEITRSVQSKLANYEQLASEELYSQHLYAKKFFPMVVHRVLNQLLGQKSEKDRMQALLRTMALPADLDPLWRQMGL